MLGIILLGTPPPPPPPPQRLWPNKIFQLRQLEEYPLQKATWQDTSNPNPQTNYLGYDIPPRQHDKIPPPGPPPPTVDPIAKAKPGLDKTQQEGYLSRLRGSLLLLVDKL